MEEFNILQFKDKYIEEAIDLLQSLENDILELEKQAHNKGLINNVFRAMHTLKGVSGMYGYVHISEYTHYMETIYQEIREEKREFSKEIFNITFQSIDHLRNLLSDAGLDSSSNKAQNEKLLKKISALIKIDNPGQVKNRQVKIEKPKADGCQTWYIILKLNESLIFRGIRILNIFRDLSSIGKFQVIPHSFLNKGNEDVWGVLLTSSASLDDIRDVFIFIEDDCKIIKLSDSDLDEIENNLSMPVQNESTYLSILDAAQKLSEGLQLPDIKNKKIEKEINVNAHLEPHAKRISVGAEKLDHLMYLVSELITLNSQLILATDNEKYIEIKNYFERLDNLSKLFRNNALDIRLVPINDLTVRFKRLIRDLSEKLGKDVDFETQGTELELDKNTIDILSDPLMHIIRNCIDHGIECPAERVKAGKPEKGLVKLFAFHAGNNIFIQIQDDGCGIDTEKIYKKAVEQGFVQSDLKLSVKEIYDLIFIPGFSTAQNLTEISGRGVGMDIVKRKIGEVRGEINIDSEKGLGTSFTIKLQQSVAILDTMLINTGDMFFLVPLTDIEICTQLPVEELNSYVHTQVIPYGDELIHFINLNTLFKLPLNTSMAKVLIINKQEKRFAIITERIIGEHQAVLKPLGKSFRKQKFFMSASLLGDGNIAFLLDLPAIYNLY